MQGYTEYIYFHVLGEPLLHPEIEAFLHCAKEMNFQVNLTTNGSLLPKRKELLLRVPPRQINISLHDWEENITPEKREYLLTETLFLAQQLIPTTYISLRLWNRTENKPSEFNEWIAEKLHQTFGTSKEAILTAERTLKLAPHIFLHNDSRFLWPNECNSFSKNRTCYALKTQLAILSNGDVVPCCIDANADLRLGNIFESSLEEILATERAVRIEEGFNSGIAVEPFCWTCGFRDK